MDWLDRVVCRVRDLVDRWWRRGDPDVSHAGLSTTEPRMADDELWVMVTDTGPPRTPPASALVTAAGMDTTDQPDLRGDRDRDPHAANPWKA